MVVSKEYEYLIANFDIVDSEGKVKKYSKILNESLEEITIEEIMYVLQHQKLPQTIKDLDYGDYINNISERFAVSQINKYDYFDGIAFLEIEVLDGNKKTTIILTNKKDILVDAHEYIGSIGTIQKLLGKKFLVFGESDGLLLGYLDKSLNVIHIRGKRVFAIDLLSTINGRKVYIINRQENTKISVNDLVLTEEELKSELNKYEEFNGVIGVYNVYLGDNGFQIADDFFSYLQIEKLYNNEFIFSFLTNDKEIKKIQGNKEYLAQEIGNKDFVINIIKNIELM